MKNQFLFLLFCCLPLGLFGQSEMADKTLAPYFMVSGAMPGVDALPLKNTAADVNISGVIADVVITQTYVNNGKTPLEATYVFPASTQAAVYGLTMTIGNRRVVARIAEREKARADYEKARSEGKRATLLEEQRPNVFQMNLANIMPGDTIEVALRYTELLRPESGRYEFVFPTVVGPRYTNGKSAQNDGFTHLMYQHSGLEPTYAFQLSAHLAAGMPLREVHSTTHRIQVENHGAEGADVRLDDQESGGANRDFILRYSLKQEKTEAGVLLYDDGKEKFFLCMTQPPRQPQRSDIPAREYIFVVDVSGSMNGFPLDVSKKLLADLIGSLRPDDRFNVILFAGTSNILSNNSLPANAENVQQARQFIDRQEGSGGTELLPALERALKLPRNAEALSRSIVVVTDGYIDVEAESYELVRQHLDEANLFAFGIGSSVNRFLLEGLAHVGGGVPFFVTDPAEAEKVAPRFREYIETPVFSQVKVNFAGFDAYDLEPSHVPDVFAQRPIFIMGKWRGDAKGEIIIKGYAGKKSKDIHVSLKNVSSDPRNAALKYLWARERIKVLSDYNGYGPNEQRDQAVTQLGLQYNLLTAFTSFIAIDEVIANKDGQWTNVKQPLPLPQGVSDLAVGFDLGISGISGLENVGNSSAMAWLLLVAGLLLVAVMVFFRKKIHVFTLFGAWALVLSLGSCAPRETVTYCSEQNVAMLLGQDRGPRNPYFISAADYYQADTSKPTEVTSCANLQAACQYLRTHRPVMGPWKEIRLVIHSNAWTGLRTPIDADSPDRTSAEALDNALQAGVFKAIPADHIDSNTHIIVDGCNAGQDTALLDALSKCFSNIQVSAAPYSNVFEKQEDRSGILHYLADFRFVVFPHGDYPGNPSIARQLAVKYPSDTTRWQAALERLHPRFTGDSYVHYFSIPVNWTTLYNDPNQRPQPATEAEKLDWVRSQPELMQQLSRMRLRPEDFRWTLSPTDYPVDDAFQPAIQAEGWAKIYGVMLPLKTPEGNLAGANGQDGRYFNRSKV